jgi:hypothetical protein
VPGGAISVTATSEGQLTPPAPAGQGGYNFAIISNCTSWLTTISGAAGTSTLQPYTADIVPVTLSQVLSYQMSVPPGGNPVPVPNLNTYLQADWFTAGNAPPSGTYPVALVSQAITAAIGGIVIVSQVPPEFISILNGTATPQAPWLVQIAGVTGKTISLFYITVCPGSVTGTNCGIAMQSTPANVLVLNFAFNTGDSPVPIPYGGFQLPIGEGLEFSVLGDSGNMSAVICYSQA